MDQIILKSKKNKGTLYYFLFFSGLFFISLSLIEILPIKVSTDKDILELVSKAFLGLLGVMCFYYVIGIKQINVYVDKIEIINLLGKSKNIYRSEIVNWTETSKESKYGNFKTLTVFFNNNKIKINEMCYLNYTQIKNEITKGKIQAKEKEEDFGRSQKTFDTVIIIAGIIFLLAIFIIQKMSN